MASLPRSDRPSDHIDNESPTDDIAQPRLGPVGYLRFFWRQLTSMRTALILLLLLALAAVPGSLVPQRSSDPNGVVQYEQLHPDTFKILDSIGLFSTFSTPWFSAIYLLLFISLIGCIIPRTKHHIDALRARPPKTPARLDRLIGFQTSTTTLDAGVAIDEAVTLLKRQGYRVERYGGVSTSSTSVSAERGYLRETGNLIFHIALVGILATVGFGGGFAYTGQRVIVEGEPFTNVLLGYDSFNPGRFFSEDQLVPYSLRLDKFTPKYQLDQKTGVWHPLDFDASLSVRDQGGDWKPATLKVNSPVVVGGTDVYLLGNGYAPVIKVTNPAGEVVFDQAVPFLPQDGNLTSLGIVKVPDGLDQQLGIQSFFYPFPVRNGSGFLTSFSPEENGQSLLTMNIYQGDLGLDNGVGVNAYTLNPDKLTEIAGLEADTPALQLTEGQKADLPNGLGTIEFSGLKRFVSLDIHHDGTQGWVLFFAVCVLGGLLVSLFVPRRRVWVKATSGPKGATKLEYAGLARGEDPLLVGAVADLARRHRAVLGDSSDGESPDPRT